MATTETQIVAAVEPPQVSIMPSEAQWAALRQIGEAAWKSGLCPDSVQSPEAAAIIMLTGWELGLAPMQSLAQIHVVKGKTGMASDLMKGLIYRAKAGRFEVLEETDDHITMRAVRTDGKGPSEPEEFTWSQQDTERAGLKGSTQAVNYPRLHKERRCTSTLAKRVFPDIIHGISSVEELEGIPDYEPRVVEAGVDGEPTRAEEKLAGYAIERLGSEGADKFRAVLNTEIARCVSAGLITAAEGKKLGGKLSADLKAEYGRRFKVNKLEEVPQADVDGLLTWVFDQLPALPEEEVADGAIEADFTEPEAAGNGPDLEDLRKEAREAAPVAMSEAAVDSEIEACGESVDALLALQDKWGTSTAGQRTLGEA